MRFAVLALSALCLVGCDSVGLDPYRPEASVTSWPEMLDAVNDVRAQEQLCGGERFAAAPPLVWNGRLEAAAERHTADMIAHDFFDHVGSDGSHPGERVTRTGYVWRTVGENIALRYDGVDAVMSAWMASEGHCRNLMNLRFREMGAVESGGLWTQLFAAPR